MKSIKGFTLIETLIALSILSVVLIAFLNVMTQSYRVWMNEDSYLASSSKGELAVQTITNQMRYACDISIAEDKDEIEFRCYYHNGDMKWLKYGLYSSAGIQALGLKKADYGEGVIDYSNYMPFINNVAALRFIDIYGDSSLYKV